MAKLYSFGASHSIGFNQEQWNPDLLYSEACYGAVMARELNYSFINRGKVGVGADFISQQVLYETPNQREDIAVVQLVGHYFFRTMYEPKTKRTFGAVIQYTSLDSNPFSFKMATTDDVMNLVDYMHAVNSIIYAAKSKFAKSLFFLCVQIPDYARISEKIERAGSDTQKKILEHFNNNLVNTICEQTMEGFMSQIPNKYCPTDNSHYNATAHKAWADFLLSRL